MQLELYEVSFQYGRRKKRGQTGRGELLSRPVLGRISLVVEPGEFLAVAGRSGSGKSTLMQLIKGFLSPTDGQLLLDGADPQEARKPEWFDRIGYIFQYPEHQLFSPSVYADIAFGLQFALRNAPADIEKRVRWAMDSVGLNYAQYKDRNPFELSGGEKRRAAIAGTIVLQPEVLILDEPTAGLDLQGRSTLFELLARLNREQGTTIIWVSHQPEEILRHASRMLLLDQGRLVADGRPADILSDRALLSAVGWEEPVPLQLRRLLLERGIDAGDRPWDVRHTAALLAEQRRHLPSTVGR